MPKHKEKVEAAIQAQIDKMKRDYMIDAQYVNELLERNECLKRVNDEQASVLTACQNENGRLQERLGNFERCHVNQAHTIQAQENQNRELRLQVERLGDRNLDLQEDNERLGKALVKHLGEQDG
jgi:hypothetical protein